MKKSFGIFAAMAVVAGFVSCQKSLEPEVGEPITITATFDSKDTSKVTITDNGKTLTPAWEIGDVVVGVINGDLSKKAAFTVASINEGVARLTTTSQLSNGNTVKVMYVKGVTSTSSIDGTGKVAVDLNMSSNLNSIKAIMYAEGTVSGGILKLEFSNKMAIVGMSVTGLSGTSVVRTVLYGDDIYNKVSVDILTGTVSGTAWGDIACEESINITSGAMAKKVYTAILPAKEFNFVAKTNEFRCFRYSNKLANPISAGKYSRISDKPASEMAVFSFNASGRVAEFAPGNLQYVQGSGFRIAANPTDAYRGQSGNVKNCTGTSTTTYSNGEVVDLFSFSMTGGPTNNANGINVFGNHTITGTFYEWGQNFHRNWTTPSLSDWTYVLTPRGTESSSSWRFAYATVGGVQGLLIRSDRSTQARPNSANTGAVEFTVNTYSSVPGGCVFLPSGYFRRRSSDTAATVYTSNGGKNHDGGYWSSTFAGEILGGAHYAAYMINFTETNYKTDHQSASNEGASVRLVHIF